MCGGKGTKQEEGMTKVKKSAGTRRKSGKVKFDKERASHAHESRSRKDQSALRMKIKLCKRQVDRLENELRNYIAKKEEKPKRKGKNIILYYK